MLNPQTPFELKETEHECPECEGTLRLVLPSNMLICEYECGPYFLVSDVVVTTEQALYLSLES